MRELKPEMCGTKKFERQEKENKKSHEPTRVAGGCASRLAFYAARIKPRERTALVRLFGVDADEWLASEDAAPAIRVAKVDNKLRIGFRASITLFSAPSGVGLLAEE